MKVKLPLPIQEHARFLIGSFISLGPQVLKFSLPAQIYIESVYFSNPSCYHLFLDILGGS